MQGSPTAKNFENFASRSIITARQMHRAAIVHRLHSHFLHIRFVTTRSAHAAFARFAHLSTLVAAVMSFSPAARSVTLPFDIMEACSAGEFVPRYHCHVPRLLDVLSVISLRVLPTSYPIAGFLYSV